MNFYDVGRLLIRRRTPSRRGVSLEAWDGHWWVPYSDVDAVLRHGYQLTAERALALLHDTRDRMALARLSDDEARTALHAPGKRA